jgi:hypothetical protein
MALKEFSQKNPSDEVFDFLLASPSPEDVIALHASAKAQERLAYLLEGNRNNNLNDAEKGELEIALQLELFVRRLKIRAAEILASKA